MSYPPSRYDGEHGEVSARLRRTDGEPDITYSNGGKVEYLASSNSADGDYGLYRWTFGEGQSGPGPHFHRTMSESFYVLRGAIEFYDGTGWVEGRPGDFLHVPPGGLHGFRNVLGAPAQMLLHFAPGGPREGYFEGLAPMKEWQPSSEELTEFYREHDNHWVEHG
jgi:quercetin dioxygenase-like cupin family protein